MKEGTRLYAVIDTNVLVSSLFSSDGTSSPAQVIKSVLTGNITLLYNDEIIEEYKEVLSRPKFNFPPSIVEDLISVFSDLGINTYRAKSEEYFPDQDDIVFYEITMSVDDAYLVTGNIKHFPRKSFVITPSQMVEILREKGLLE